MADFKTFLKTTFEKVGIKNDYIELLTNEKSMYQYQVAFTSAAFNKYKNYELYEHLGDYTANKCIVYYLLRRFPELNCKMGVKVLARLKIRYSSQDELSKLADELGFYPWIKRKDTGEKTTMELLEDVFEAFIGATEILIDELTMVGVGYAICYHIISFMLDKREISLSYNSLFDAKTRLYELSSSMFGNNLKIKTEQQANDQFISTVTLKHKGESKLRFLAKSDVFNKKIHAELNAAEKALSKLKKDGFEKPVPQEYLEICGLTF